MKYGLIFLSLFALMSFSQASFAGTPDKSFRIWPMIPLIRGADLCAYKDAYTSTRSEYMNQMVHLASSLMQEGAYGREALGMIQSFNDTYNKNKALGAKSTLFLDVTLENSFKASLDNLYRRIRPREKRLVFFNTGEALQVIEAAKSGAIGNPNFDQLGFIVYGTYSFGPSCRGDVLVTLHFIERNGAIESFQGQGTPETVMNVLAEQIFSHYQRTRFPVTVSNEGRPLTVIGALNGDIGVTIGVRAAERACKSLQARLPTAKELELLEAYGEWNGGVNLGRQPWSIAGDYVFHPVMRNPSPVRSETSLNDKEFLYICVK